MTDKQSADDQSLDSNRQCILYYSNPNFVMDQETTTLQFGTEDDDDDEDDDELDDDDEAISADFDVALTGSNRHQQRLAIQPHDDIDLEHLTDAGATLHDSAEDAYTEFYNQDDGDGTYRHRVNHFGHHHQHHTSDGGNCSFLGGGIHQLWSDCTCSFRPLVSCLQSRPCLFFIYVLVVLVLLSSFVSLILVGVLVAEPYVRVAGFINVSCRTQEVSVGREEQSCSCGKGCNSKYKCLKIEVEFVDLSGTVNSAVLFDDETSLNRQCSYYPPCRSSRMENEEAVISYERQYGRRGLDFSCLYNPNVKPEVIQHRRFHLYHVINGITWSLIVFILSFVMLLYILKKRGCFRS